MKRKKRTSLQKRKAKFGLLFILPWLIGFITFVLWPLVQSFYFSLNVIRMRPTGRVFNFVGFANYQNVWLKDMFFVQELINFAVSTALRLPVIVVFSLIIALLLNGRIKLKGMFRTIFFLPVVIASGPIMDQLINQGATSIPMIDQSTISNLLNTFLPIWLVTPVSSLFEQIIIVLWYSGVQILIFVAGLQKVDKSLYEAAKIDGGSAWECFWKITLPILKPMILLNSIYTLVTLANSGQNSIINLIYSNMFSATRGYGFASAMAWMYSIVVVVILGLVGALLGGSANTDKKGKKLKKKKAQKKKNKTKKMYLKRKRGVEDGV